jgi:diguanylate cyclase (GGDEF)-like protein
MIKSTFMLEYNYGEFMDNKVLEELKFKYNIDFFHDMLLQKREHVCFYFVLGISPMKFNILYGDVTKLGFNDKPALYSHDIIPNVALDNALAEVEGKQTFLRDLVNKVKSIKDELYFYIPLKNNDEVIWLYIGLHKVINSSGNLIFGQVLRIYNHTPDEIIYYKKTYQDPLTQLFTRETLKKHLDMLNNQTNAYGIYFDIDGFKEINDRFGHLEGDRFLIDLANFFISNWEQNVIYYRLGGDEFFIYVYNHTKDEIMKRAEKLIYDIENLNEKTKEIGVSASLGIVAINGSNRNYHSLLDQGDQLMYQSKRKGKGNITMSD